MRGVEDGAAGTGGFGAGGGLSEWGQCLCLGEGGKEVEDGELREGARKGRRRWEWERGSGGIQIGNWWGRRGKMSMEGG